jgi:hypothetical protein
VARWLKKLRVGVPDERDGTSAPQVQVGTSGRLTEEEKRWLVAMLGKRHPIHGRHNRYEDVIRAFKRETGKQVSLRSLARWAAAVADGKPLAAASSYARNGRGNSDEGCFTDWLVPYLNRTFTTAGALKYQQQWRFWTVREIRFMLLFGVLPPRMAVLGELEENLRAGLYKLAKDCGSWQALSKLCIEKPLTHDELPQAVANYITRCNKSEKRESTPFDARMKFCERSIRAALKEGGYVANQNRAFADKAPRWVRRASPPAEQTGEGLTLANDAGCSPSVPDAEHGKHV